MTIHRTAKLEALKRTRLFALLTEQALEGLIARCHEVHLEAGEILFTGGEQAKGLFVVVEGRTRALRHGPDGREQIIHEDGPGATFSEVAVFDGGSYPSSVIAVEESHLLMLPTSDVRRFCLAHPEVALAALEVLSYRLRKATGMVEDFALKDVGQRLAEYLLEEAGEDSESVKTPLLLRHTNQEIADLIGTVREVVSRAFTKLQKQGWIDKAGRRVRINDPEALGDYLEGGF